MKQVNENGKKNRLSVKTKAATVGIFGVIGYLSTSTPIILFGASMTPLFLIILAIVGFRVILD
ncbi:MAG: hypothetical protein PHX34_03145 [Candidatus Shapirobacteria bacterium]|nr:hypothetical protein [Candidatus Shapirobacteria bacterium]